jgi:signal transduction histidine kinase
MSDQHLTKAQLHHELNVLRARVAELERALGEQAPDGEQRDQLGRSNDGRSMFEPDRVEQLLVLQQRFFERLAAGAGLDEVLDILARKVESQIDSGLCSILLLDAQRRHLYHSAAPSLPQEYTRAIDGAAIGPTAGSCGVAAFLGQLVIVEDIASDPLWADYRSLALSHGLSSCWSAPFFDHHGNVLGTLAIYYRAPRAPIDAEIKEVQRAAYLAAVAVERKRAEHALRESQETAREFQARLKTLHLLTIELSAAGSFDELCRLALELGRARLGFDRLSLWFLDSDPHYVVGSFGTDEYGSVGDERGARRRVELEKLSVDVYFSRFPSYFRNDADLYNDVYEVVGRGWNGIAGLWDRDRVIGYISADNLLSQLPITIYQIELLVLYGSTLGHLLVRKRTELDLERHIAERTVQLEAANKELEAFSYSVSHDLRAPLRHIDGFARMLAMREADRLDPTSARYVKVIGDAARKMGQLIDDLLSFSRMSRTEIQMRPVDLDQLVAGVRYDLAPVVEGRSIDWQIGALPLVSGDPAMIGVVVSNLISNAVKYTAPRALARITIDATDGDGDEVIISVGDNGVGFDMAYAHKLFGVFQRLHRDEEFEGTGIGLATVRRIISRHGGRVWAKAALDAGATFYMTLKRHRSADADEKNPAG